MLVLRNLRIMDLLCLVCLYWCLLLDLKTTDPSFGMPMNYFKGDRIN